MSIHSILVVDDDEKLCSLLESYFLQEQFTVYIAHDGKTALHILRSRSPQIMLLDLMLPGMDGFEVCRRVRQFSDIPIIMLTAKMMKQIVSSVFLLAQTTMWQSLSRERIDCPRQ